MNRLNFPRFVVVLFLVLGNTPRPVAAMDFPHFDAMNDEQRSEYLAFMVDTAELAFRANGHADFADQTEKLFNTVSAGDWLTLGMIELSENVDRARLADAKRIAADPNALRIDVEAALFVTLKKNQLMIAPDEMREVLDAMNGYHWMTFADFVKVPPANQRRIIAIDANWAAFNLELERMVEKRLAGKADDTSKETLLMQRDVANDEFMSSAQPGTAAVLKEIAEASATKPNEPGVLYTVYMYILKRVDDRVSRSIQKMRDETLHLNRP